MIRPIEYTESLSANNDITVREKQQQNTAPGFSLQGGFRFVNNRKWMTDHNMPPATLTGINSVYVQMDPSTYAAFKSSYIKFLLQKSHIWCSNDFSWNQNDTLCNLISLSSFHIYFHNPTKKEAILVPWQIEKQMTFI